MVPVQRQCDVENLNDFCRYYQQAWVGWHPTDSADISPCFVNGMLDERRAILRLLSKAEGNAFFMGAPFNATWSNIREHVDFGVPEIGMIQDGPTIAFCSYSTPRQARKGFRCRDARIATFNSWQIRKKYLINVGGDRHDWTWFAFNPEYLSLERAEDRLAKGEAVGIPLSRTLGVYSLPSYKHSLLAYKRWTVGHVLSPELIHLKSEYEDYEEDISRQTGAEVIVG